MSRPGTLAIPGAAPLQHESGLPGEAADVAVFCVASPLHYLAACQVAQRFEQGARRVLVVYRPSVMRSVDAARWEAVVEAPWPRMWPMAGPFGRHRRLLDNVRRVMAACGPAARGGRVHLHAPVFDTEAVNYLLAALCRVAGAREVRARILPDGVLNLASYPLSTAARIGQHVRRLRSLVSPMLSYTTFGGDRTGSDAPFVDRIYVLEGFTSPYRRERVTVLSSLAFARQTPDGSRQSAEDQPLRALVIGQPLTGDRRMRAADVEAVARSIEEWLAAQGITDIRFKAHPRDSRHDLRRPSWQLLEIEVPLEQHLAESHYDVVVGVTSTTLFLARQICGPAVRVAAFGTDRFDWRAPGKREEVLALMRRLGIDRPDAADRGDRRDHDQGIALQR